jgi:hypothetical protein
VATFCNDHFIGNYISYKSKGNITRDHREIMYHALCREMVLPDMDIDLGGLRGYGQERKSCSSVFIVERRKEPKTIIGNLVNILHPQQEVVSCKFLFKMSKMAMVYSATPALISELEKRVGMVLDDANETIF